MPSFGYSNSHQYNFAVTLTVRAVLSPFSSTFSIAATSANLYVAVNVGTAIINNRIIGITVQIISRV